MAHLELLTKKTRISDLTVEVKPNQPISVGVWGFTEGLSWSPPSTPTKLSGKSCRRVSARWRRSPKVKSSSRS
jgi:hypothetical protein